MRELKFEITGLAPGRSRGTRRDSEGRRSQVRIGPTILATLAIAGIVGIAIGSAGSPRPLNGVLDFADVRVGQTEVRALDFQGLNLRSQDKTIITTSTPDEF